MNQLEISLKDDVLFTMIDHKGKTYYGCNQAWFPTPWSRGSGCGPAAASDLFYYLSCVKEKGAPLSPLKERTRRYQKRNFPPL